MGILSTEADISVGTLSSQISDIGTSSELNFRGLLVLGASFLEGLEQEYSLPIRPETVPMDAEHFFGFDAIPFVSAKFDLSNKSSSGASDSSLEAEAQELDVLPWRLHSNSPAAYMSQPA